MAITMVLKACGGLGDLGVFMVVLVSPFGAADGSMVTLHTLGVWWSRSVGEG